MGAFEYVFPAIRGVQAGREYYVSMCPMGLIPKIFLFDEEELRPELRAQRTLNKGRIPEMARYLVENRNDYVFSAITASVDASVKFESLAPEGEGERVGVVRIPMNAKFIINDGQHRRAAIEAALGERPELADETIAVVFFLDKGLARCQQMFADLNRHAVRPSRSLGLLYEHRDEMAKLTKLVVFNSDVFGDVVEMERSNLSARSRKLFTLSAIHTATRELLAGMEVEEAEEGAKLAVEFWEQVAKQFPEWDRVRKHKMSAGELRSDFIHSHGVVLQAIGKAGNALLRTHERGWKRRLARLRGLDWRHTNAADWEGRAMIGGRVSKAATQVTLTTNVIKRTLGLELSPDEQRVEDAFQRGEYAHAS